MTDEHGIWSDERVAAAYRSRFGSARAGTLDTTAVEAVRRIRRPLIQVPAAALRAAMAAVLMVALAGSATVLAPMLEDRPPHSPAVTRGRSRRPGRRQP